MPAGLARRSTRVAPLFDPAERQVAGASEHTGSRGRLPSDDLDRITKQQWLVARKAEWEEALRRRKLMTYSFDSPSTLSQRLAGRVISEEAAGPEDVECEWLQAALLRLRREQARELADSITFLQGTPRRPRSASAPGLARCVDVDCTTSPTSSRAAAALPSRTRGSRCVGTLLDSPLESGSPLEL